jgi:hypothetical protein
MSQYSDARFPVGGGRPRRREHATPREINRHDLSPEAQMPYHWPRGGYAGGLSYSTIVWATAAGLMLLVLIALIILMADYRW